MCCGRTGSHPRNHPGKNLLSDLCPATVCTSALQQIIKSTSSIPSTPISFCPLCSPHLVDPHKMYQQQVKGLSAPHHFILNINNRTFTKSSFGWMESRPWIARPTIHQNRPQNSIVLSERISLISILTKILTPVYLENIWFLDKTGIQSTEISVKSKRKTPLSPEIRDAFPSPLKWIVLGVVSDYLLLVRWHSQRSRCSISGQRRPDNRATPTRKLVFNGAVHKYTQLVRAKSATNRLKIKESSVGLPLNMFLCCKLYVARMKEDVYLVVWLLSISRLRRR